MGDALHLGGVLDAALLLDDDQAAAHLGQVDGDRATHRPDGRCRTGGQHPLRQISTTSPRGRGAGRGRVFLTRVRDFGTSGSGGGWSSTPSGRARPVKPPGI